MAHRAQLPTVTGSLRARLPDQVVGAVDRLAHALVHVENVSVEGAKA